MPAFGTPLHPQDGAITTDAEIAPHDTAYHAPRSYRDFAEDAAAAWTAA